MHGYLEMRRRKGTGRTKNDFLDFPFCCICLQEAFHPVFPGTIVMVRPFNPFLLSSQLSQAGHLASLNLSFLTCKMGLNMVTAQGAYEN